MPLLFSIKNTIINHYYQRRLLLSSRTRYTQGVLFFRIMFTDERTVFLTRANTNHTRTIGMYICTEKTVREMFI